MKHKVEEPVLIDREKIKLLEYKSENKYLKEILNSNLPDYSSLQKEISDLNKQLDEKDEYLKVILNSKSYKLSRRISKVLKILMWWR